MLLHTCTNILVKTLFGNDVVRRFSYLANTYVLGIIDGTYVGMCEDTGTI